MVVSRGVLPCRLLFCWVNASMGWSIFPLRPNSKLPLTAHGFKDATRDPSRILAWKRQHPEANWGIATGLVSGLLVVDVDVKNGGIGMESLKTIRGMVPRDTYCVSTPSGGFHFYYRLTVPVKSRNGFMSGVDIKADGGYVVGAGSKIDGKEYVCVNDAPLKEASLHLIALVCKTFKKPPPAREVEKTKLHLSGGPIERARSYPLEQLVGLSGFVKCPYHDDKTPSLWVRNGFGYCFPCQKRVDSIDYVRKTLGLGFKEAVEYLNREAR